jgi:cob(I)alamin adenosyltransferase
MSDWPEGRRKDYILEKGCVQVYTGDGKGKSTAAFGAAARMAGRGGQVFVGRFLKGRTSGECILTEDIAGIDVEDFGSKNFVIGTPSKADRDAAARGIARMYEVLTSGLYDMVIADEVGGALSLGLIPERTVFELISNRPPRTELILTGRDMPQRVLDIADLVTEMRAVKHYYDDGVPARRGIEE